MTRDDMYDLIIGASVVAIGYMLWKQHKSTRPAPSIADTVTDQLANVGQPLQLDAAGGYTFDFSNLFEGVF